MPERGRSRGVRKRGKTTRARRRVLLQRTAVVAALLALGGIVLGLAFAGSPRRLPAGLRIAGVDVGGLTPSAAQSLLERKAAALARVPVTFHAAGRTWRFTPNQLGVKVAWREAVRSALREGAGFAPLRGFKRLEKLVAVAVTDDRR